MGAEVPTARLSPELAGTRGVSMDTEWDSVIWRQEATSRAAGLASARHFCSFLWTAEQSPETCRSWELASPHLCAGAAATPPCQCPAGGTWHPQSSVGQGHSPQGLLTWCQAVQGLGAVSATLVWGSAHPVPLPLGRAGWLGSTMLAQLRRASPCHTSRASAQLSSDQPCLQCRLLSSR